MNQAAQAEVVANGYDQVADAYAQLEAEHQQWPREQWLRRLQERLPDGSRVLDLGCGNGVPVTAALAQRHRVTGVDVSAAQIERARVNVPGAEFAQADLLELAYPTGSFDAVVAFYTVDHLPRERLADLFGRLHSWLRPGGLLLFTAEIDDQPGVVEQWLGAPMFFSSYPPETTRALVEQAGFAIVREAVQPQQEGQTTVEYLWVLAQRGGAAAVA